jgi:hypothetical protein
LRGCLLAIGETQCLPWEDIWAAVASRAAGTTYTDDDLFWLRKHAGSYDCGVLVLGGRRLNSMTPADNSHQLAAAIARRGAEVFRAA